MAAYTKRLKQDLDRWVTRGLVDRSTADALLADAVSQDRRSLSFGFVLMMMAALLLGAAVLLVVASNWEAIPRLTRVVLLFCLIFVGYVGGALLKLRGHDALAEGAWLIAAATFGGAIALIGQMYHLSGDEEAALLTWFGGTLLAAAVLRSGPLTIGAGGIAVFWMVAKGFDLWSGGDLSRAYPIVAALVWAVSLWTGSSYARHLVALSLVLYAVVLAFHYDVTAVSLVLAGVSALLFAVAVLDPKRTEQIVRLDGRLDMHALIGFLTGAAMLQFDHMEETATLVLAAVIVFAAIIAALLLAGRESRGLRWIAYLGFTFELCFLYVTTLGTMLGTAGLFLASGVVLALIALLIIRVERRMNLRAA
ncbi:DUF2157 domain-containing protein [Pseudaminobacter sp. 19-2017]|uniref:DUF2157 domain-containing protein n=1 Tax=Pseudaminobacter soli (ex Zhang et al. 2022) TaxID=2831468 RepID=A0A942I2G1_9HYPH|nr:DUF2157 domain-containing protein [Pseudaminobacter soli]MBS3649622.1 DUF2157 domain-containing protein [Pseudaminobacter soli]